MAEALERVFLSRVGANAMARGARATNCYRQSHSELDVAYVLASAADEHRRQRDSAVGVLRKLVEAQETAVSTTEFGIMASDIADHARTSLACIDGEGTASPRPKGPTPEAGYQSLLRETAGERLGATKGDEG